MTARCARIALNIACGILTACEPNDYSLGAYPPWPDAALEVPREAAAVSAYQTQLEPRADAAALSNDTAPDAASPTTDAAADALGPSTTEGLLLWLRADEGLDATEQVLSSWTDTFTGRVATAPSMAASPNVVSDEQGAPVVAFGGDDELVLPEMPALSAFTLLLVVEADEQADCPSFFHLSNREPDLSTTDEIEVGRHMNTLYYESVRSPVPAPAGVFPVTERQLVAVIQQSGGNAELFMNHALVINAIVPTPPNVVRTANFIGNNHWEREIDGQCQPFIGRIAELMFYARALTESERAEVEGYLDARWF